MGDEKGKFNTNIQKYKAIHNQKFKVKITSQNRNNHNHKHKKHKWFTLTSSFG